MEALVLLRVELRLGVFRDHDVAPAFGDEARDLEVLVMGRDFGAGEVGEHEGLVGAARILDDAHVGLVEVVERPELVLHLHVNERDLAERRVGGQEVGDERASGTAGDAAHGHVEPVVLEVGRHLLPGGRDELDLPAVDLGHRLDDVNVVARVAGILLHREWPVVARRADAKRVVLNDVVESFARCGGNGAKGGEGCDGAGEGCECACVHDCFETKKRQSASAAGSDEDGSGQRGAGAAGMRREGANPECRQSGVSLRRPPSWRARREWRDRPRTRPWR